VEARFRQENFNIWNLLTESLKIFKIGLPTFLGIFLFYLILTSILLSITRDVSFEILGGSLTFDWWGWLILFVLTVMTEITIAYQIESIVKGQPASMADTLLYAINRLPKAILIYTGLVIILGGTWGLTNILIRINILALVLIIPAIILDLHLVFTIPIAALRNLGLRSFKYSIDLIVGQGIKVYIILVVISFFEGGIQDSFSVLRDRMPPDISNHITWIDVVSMAVSLLFFIPIIVFFLNQDYHYIPPRRGWADDVPQK
jgi:hypothetical protein